MASSDTCFNISKVSENVFPNFKISHEHAAHENHPFLIDEKSAKQARHAFPLIDTMSKQTKTIQFVEFAQGNPLLRSATGGTSLHIRAGALIQKFGNFTD